VTGLLLQPDPVPHAELLGHLARQLNPAGPVQHRVLDRVPGRVAVLVGGQRADHGQQHRLGQGRQQQLPAGRAPGRQHRGLALALAGQQPRGQRRRDGGQQQQLQRADEQHRPGHHQAADQRGQNLR
jgi:hypothetical protein